MAESEELGLHTHIASFVLIGVGLLSEGTMADIERILRQTTTIAVMWANPRESAPAHYVPAYMSAQGHRVYPIHVAQAHAGKMLWGMPMMQRLEVVQNRCLMVDHRNMG